MPHAGAAPPLPYTVRGGPWGRGRRWFGALGVQWGLSDDLWTLSETLSVNVRGGSRILGITTDCTILCVCVGVYESGGSGNNSIPSDL